MRVKLRAIRRREDKESGPVDRGDELHPLQVLHTYVALLRLSAELLHPNSQLNEQEDQQGGEEGRGTCWLT
jgi:hypothetical protein